MPPCWCLSVTIDHDWRHVAKKYNLKKLKSDEDGRKIYNQLVNIPDICLIDV